MKATTTPAPAEKKEPARPPGVLFEGATSAERKEVPMAEGLLDYFPDACAYVAFVSKKGNDQHNPGQPMHWAREKSGDHANCILRHLKDRGKFDEKGILHDGNLAWRAMANLQETLERMFGLPQPRRATALPPAPVLPAR